MRTPLANIAAEAQYALRHTTQDEDGRHALQNVLDSARQMGQTLDTLIAAARADLDLHPATSDAQAAVRAATRSAAPPDAGARITTSLHAPREVPLVVGEQALVERILAPVIENAYRHAHHRVSITIEHDGGTVRFGIDDDGPGVPPGEHEAIFEPGNRAPGGVLSAVNGAGLGLALSRRLARSAGGDVNTEDGPRGARFVVRLPAA